MAKATATGAQGSALLKWIATFGLLLVVAVPCLFIVIQAIFPDIGSGSLAAPFSLFIKTLSDPALFLLAGNTLVLGVGTVVFAALFAVPLAALRALFRVARRDYLGRLASHPLHDPALYRSPWLDHDLAATRLYGTIDRLQSVRSDFLRARYHDHHGAQHFLCGLFRALAHL